MTRDKRIGLLLSSACIVFGGIAAWQFYGLGSGFTLAENIAAAVPIKIGELKPANAALPPWPEFMAIIEKPIFNESRKPEENPTEAEAPKQAAAPLTANLTSVLITETLKMAMLRDPNTQKVMRIREGQNLEGDFAQWRLIELQPRSAVFEADGTRQELQITAGQGNVNFGSPTPTSQAPPPPPQQQSSQVVANTTIGGSTPLVMPTAGQVADQQRQDAAAASYQNPNADEIRRRIEERRRQLREEARRMMEQQKQ